MSAPQTLFEVRRAGPLALLQDAGRFGVRRLGVTQGGPADAHAWAWANRLVGNAWGTTGLEITMGGLELVCRSEAVIAVCGADLGASLDGEALPLWQGLRVEAGQRLSFQQPVNGLRAYLAVAGGFEAEQVLGSTATVTREGLGGLHGDGQPLQEGDRLSRAAGPSGLQPGQQAPADAIIDYRQAPRLALIPGAQVAAFEGRSLYQAFNATWQVDDRADRMGVRLRGPELKCRSGGMISEGIGPGAVQVPPDGQPIALLNDRQTIGGYPRLGALTPLACARLAQCLPGQQVRLQPTSLEQASRAYRAFRSCFGES
ncbi:biotin-dependent carboxyltransferase family protein [Halomonas sabkhae]|uniref:5-oxoprolinase subunit C family protein n=1 Tax=Halomonas sabkhae TaxID=626223 RepID=UPI0025B49C12|nr:biotin-dependent carboxyltransferase family protein [Halomonas sabkhae]MDN3526642.1 biotin-dependent carboxyltransferase family protein [Halomonas sabkhae]